MVEVDDDSLRKNCFRYPRVKYMNRFVSLLCLKASKLTCRVKPPTLAMWRVKFGMI